MPRAHVQGSIPLQASARAYYARLRTIALLALLDFAGAAFAADQSKAALTGLDVSSHVITMGSALGALRTASILCSVISNAAAGAAIITALHRGWQTIVIMQH